VNKERRNEKNINRKPEIERRGNGHILSAR